MDDVKEKVINDLLEALKIRHDDAVMSDEPGVALIPYFSHGRMQAHEIDLDYLAQVAVSRLIIEGFIPAEQLVK
ncbi:hypothetical protein [Roseibium sp.]|uniref:hypothetical protein n=1 Tax=Roseibium sp. TaxID=1936156 RepID=UPI003B529589